MISEQHITSKSGTSISKALKIELQEFAKIFSRNSRGVKANKFDWNLEALDDSDYQFTFWHCVDFFEKAVIVLGDILKEGSAKEQELLSHIQSFLKKCFDVIVNANLKLLPIEEKLSFATLKSGFRELAINANGISTLKELIPIVQKACAEIKQQLNSDTLFTDMLINGGCLLPDLYWPYRSDSAVSAQYRKMAHDLFPGEGEITLSGDIYNRPERNVALSRGCTAISNAFQKKESFNRWETLLDKNVCTSCFYIGSAKFFFHTIINQHFYLELYDLHHGNIMNRPLIMENFQKIAEVHKEAAKKGFLDFFKSVMLTEEEDLLHQILAISQPEVFIRKLLMLPESKQTLARIEMLAECSPILSYSLLVFLKMVKSVKEELSVVTSTVADDTSMGGELHDNVLNFMAAVKNLNEAIAKEMQLYKRPILPSITITTKDPNAKVFLDALAGKTSFTVSSDGELTFICPAPTDPDQFYLHKCSIIDPENFGAFRLFRYQDEAPVQKKFYSYFKPTNEKRTIREQLKVILKDIRAKYPKLKKYDDVDHWYGANSERLLYYKALIRLTKSLQSITDKKVICLGDIVSCSMILSKYLTEYFRKYEDTKSFMRQTEKKLGEITVTIYDMLSSELEKFYRSVASLFLSEEWQGEIHKCLAGIENMCNDSKIYSYKEFCTKIFEGIDLLTHKIMQPFSDLQNKSELGKELESIVNNFIFVLNTLMLKEKLQLPFIDPLYNDLNITCCKLRSITTAISTPLRNELVKLLDRISEINEFTDQARLEILLNEAIADTDKIYKELDEKDEKKPYLRNLSCKLREINQHNLLINTCEALSEKIARCTPNVPSSVQICIANLQKSLQTLSDNLEEGISKKPEITQQTANVVNCLEEVIYALKEQPSQKSDLLTELSEFRDKFTALKEGDVNLGIVADLKQAEDPEFTCTIPSCSR